MALLAAYAFDENTGTTSTDASGNSRTATITAWGTGHTGSAAIGNSTHSSAHYSGTVLSSPTALTYMYWFYPTDNTTQASIDWVTSDSGGGGGASSGQWISTFWYDSTHLGLGIRNSSVDYTSASVTTPLNTWVHVAVTWVGNTATLYLNGSSVLTLTATNISVLSSVSWIEAGGAQASTFLSYNMGRVDDFRFYDIALTSTQITTCMNTPVGTAASPPLLTELANYSESNGGSGNVISRTTSTLSIPANSTVLVFAHGTASGTYWTGDAITVSDSVDGTTGWTGLDSLAITTSPDAGAGRVFSKSFTSSTSRTITIARGTGTAWWGYSVVAVTGHNTSNPIIQAKGAASPYWNDFGSSHSWSVTLGSNPISGNAVIAFLGCNNDTNGAATLPSGYTALDLPTGTFENASVAYNTTTTTATINWPDCGQGVESAIAIAVEINVVGTGAIAAPFITA